MSIKQKTKTTGHEGSWQLAMDDGQREEGIETFAGDKQCVSPDTATVT